MPSATRTFLLLSEPGDRPAMFQELLQATGLPHQLLTTSHTSSAAHLCRHSSVDIIFWAVERTAAMPDTASGSTSKLANQHRAQKVRKLAELIARLGRSRPPVIVIGQSDVRAAVAMIRAGAVNYLERDRLTDETLRQAIQAAGESADAIVRPADRAAQTTATATEETASEEIASEETARTSDLEADWRESEPLFRAMIEHLPGAAVFVVDRDLRYLLAEGEGLRAVGLMPADLIGKKVTEWLPEELVAPCVKRYRQALRGESFEHDRTFGSHSYLSRGTPLRSATGEIYAVLVVSYDMSKQQQAEAAIAADLQAMKRLHDLSIQTVVNADTQTLYQEIMATAIALTEAEAGCFQALDDDSQELVMLAHEGFEPGFIERFTRVDSESNTSCGLALATGQRRFVNFETEVERAAPNGSGLETARSSLAQPDSTQQRYIEAGLLSAQSTRYCWRIQ